MMDYSIVFITLLVDEEKGRLLFKLLDPLTSLRYRVRIDLEQIKIKK